MTEQIAQWFAGLPKEWVVFVISMLPIVELRGAIPWALSPAMGPPLHWAAAFGIAFCGNLVPIVPILLYLGPGSDLLRRRSPQLDRFFTWLFERTRRRGRLVERYGAIGLTLFVAIPLPVTGAWTGSAAAFVFGIPFRRALPCVALGVVISGTIMTLASLGIFSLIGR
ncbi:MAG: small multi-drug export protein [Candidatus Eisenbacteria sp.]|nr:small multi-drug export protein [Candidatus Eisenbacteria bacterium]